MPGWCPPELEAVIAACLAKDAADRPADARALAAQLRAIPAEAEWTAEHAEAWWRAHQPAIPPTRAAASEIQIIKPRRTELRPGAATSEDGIAQPVASAPTRD